MMIVGLCGYCSLSNYLALGDNKDILDPWMDSDSYLPWLIPAFDNVHYISPLLPLSVLVWRLCVFIGHCLAPCFFFGLVLFSAL